MCAALNDLSTVDDQYLGIADGGQTMSTDETGAALHPAQQGVLDAGFGTRAHTRGSFV